MIKFDFDNLIRITTVLITVLIIFIKECTL